MLSTSSFLRSGSWLGSAVVCAGCMVALGWCQPPDPPADLRIGLTTNLLPATDKLKAAVSRESLTGFIKSEVGLDNVVSRVPSAEKLAEQLEQGDLHLGVFSGHEFAWVRERYPRLQALAVAVNESPHCHVHVLVRRDHAAQDLAGLRGQTLTLPRGDAGNAEFFVQRHHQLQGLPAKEFFASVAETASQETALDDVVEGKVQAAAIDRVALRAYQRRKPGRFRQLREVAQSLALPPPVVAYRQGALDENIVRKLQDGLVQSANSKTGKAMLTLSKLTGFAVPPADFDRQLAEVRRAYPPPSK